MHNFCLVQKLVRSLSQLPSLNPLSPTCSHQGSLSRSTLGFSHCFTFSCSPSALFPSFCFTSLSHSSHFSFSVSSSFFLFFGFSLSVSFFLLSLSFPFSLPWLAQFPTLRPRSSFLRFFLVFLNSSHVKPSLLFSFGLPLFSSSSSENSLLFFFRTLHNVNLSHLLFLLNLSIFLPSVLHTLFARSPTFSQCFYSRSLSFSVLGFFFSFSFQIFSQLHHTDASFFFRSVSSFLYAHTLTSRLSALFSFRSLELLPPSFFTRAPFICSSWSLFISLLSCFSYVGLPPM